MVEFSEFLSEFQANNDQRKNTVLPDDFIKNDSENHPLLARFNSKSNSKSKQDLNPGPYTVLPDDFIKNDSIKFNENPMDQGFDSPFQWNNIKFIKNPMDLGIDIPLQRTKYSLPLEKNELNSPRFRYPYNLATYSENNLLLARSNSKSKEDLNPGPWNDITNNVMFFEKIDEGFHEKTIDYSDPLEFGTPTFLPSFQWKASTQTNKNKQDPLAQIWGRPEDPLAQIRGRPEDPLAQIWGRPDKTTCLLTKMKVASLVEPKPMFSERPSVMTSKIEGNFLITGNSLIPKINLNIEDKGEVPTHMNYNPSVPCVPWDPKLTDLDWDQWEVERLNISEEIFDKKNERFEDENGNLKISHLNDENYPTASELMVVPSVVILILFMFSLRFFCE